MTTSMKSFEKIWRETAKQKGGDDIIEARMPTVKSARALARAKDDRLLAAAAMAVFRAGFVWRIVEAKWPTTEEAFFQFSPGRVAFLDERELGELACDDRVIKHRAKIEAVRDNARMMLDVANEHGSFAKFIARWPDDDTIGLWAYLKEHGSRLGGNSGPYFLRDVGKDTFLPTGDVSRALIRLGVVDKKPTSKKDLKKTQEAFNAWREESGRTHAEISRTLALWAG